MRRDLRPPGNLRRPPTDLAQPRIFSTDFGDFDLRPELTIFWAEVARGPARSQISNRHPPRGRYQCERPHGGVKSGTAEIRPPSHCHVTQISERSLPRHPLAFQWTHHQGNRAATSSSGKPKFGRCGPLPNLGNFVGYFCPLHYSISGGQLGYMRSWFPFDGIPHPISGVLAQALSS